MKKVVSLLIATMMMVSVMSQSIITLKFTGRMADGTYIRLDSVKVENLNRGWSEVLVYPDTVMTIDPRLELNSVSDCCAEMKAYPNPFRGNTTLELHLSEADNVSVRVYTLSGQEVAGFSQAMEAGAYLFDVSLRNSMAYLCAVQTSLGIRTLKLVNSVGAGRNSIAVKGLAGVSEKRFANQISRSGDRLKHIGYATFRGRKVESEEIAHQQSGNENFTLFFVDTTEGALAGLFSVDTNRQVRFSKGNLQWSATGGGTTATTHAAAEGRTAAGTWRFAQNQWDVIGAANRNISSSYTGWIDLFGWGTSGFNSEFPYTISDVAYYGNCNADISESNFDWGVYNAISNGGNWPGVWRLLTEDEMNYLFVLRAGADWKYGIARVNGVNGLVLLPDSWSLPSGLSFISGTSGGFYQNNYGVSQWQVMEANGAVFLPAAGYRSSTSVSQVGNEGYYWTATGLDSFSAYNLLFTNTSMYTSSTHARYHGLSVRLVQDVN